MSNSKQSFLIRICLLPPITVFLTFLCIKNSFTKMLDGIDAMEGLVLDDDNLKRDYLDWLDNAENITISPISIFILSIVSYAVFQVYFSILIYAFYLKKNNYQ